MVDHTVTFDISSKPVVVKSGTLLAEAAKLAGIDIMQPCGGQGRCGRCAVKIESGGVRRRSTLRLTTEDIEAGYALACQTVIESDVHVSIPPQEKLERRLTTDRTVGEITIPASYNAVSDQTIKRVCLSLEPPSLEDQTDDLSRLRIALRQQAKITSVSIPLEIIRRLGDVLRKGNWEATVYLDVHLDPTEEEIEEIWMLDILPGLISEESPFWGVAIDIGTTTVTLWLVDLSTGKVHAQVAQYNRQIARGEDVISRIVYSSKNGGMDEIQQMVLETINELLEKACKRVKGQEVKQTDVYKATITGNSTMIHLLLGVPAMSIRLTPYITAVNQPPMIRAQMIGLKINPMGVVNCLPGVASYVGADISAGVYSSGMDHTDMLTLFMDVGTNGEIVLGTREWLVTCACSAGPAFEGAGVTFGMRATKGAIEEVWVNSETYVPTYRVIGGGKPRGFCGSGLISLLAEMFMTGVVDKAGHLNTQLGIPRIREGKHGLEYVVAWADESQYDQDISITHVDIDNLLRAKAAIYAGFSVLAQSVGVPLEATEQILIGGSFGKYINVEKAIQIGLLPDLPWERFQFLGNTSVKGAYLALLDKNAHQRIKAIAEKMTYIELSADNTFYEAFMSAMFLPHTDMSNFPTIARAMSGSKNQ
jgi:uncharacterized 2Fe-2S/4Fe-4S cluster protein (DUF4445 family)